MFLAKATIDENREVTEVERIVERVIEKRQQESQTSETKFNEIQTVIPQAHLNKIVKVADLQIILIKTIKVADLQIILIKTIKVVFNLWSSGQNYQGGGSSGSSGQNYQGGGSSGSSGQNYQGGGSLRVQDKQSRCWKRIVWEFRTKLSRWWILWEFRTKQSRCWKRIVWEFGQNNPAEADPQMPLIKTIKVVILHQHQI